MRFLVAIAMAILAAVGPSSAQKGEREEARDRRQALDHYEKGRDALAAERPEEAVREFKAAVQLDPLLTLAHFRLGQAHMVLKEYPEAERALLACREAHEKLAGMQLSNREEVERRRADELEQLNNELTLIASGQNKNPNPSRPLQIQQRISELERNRRKGGSEAPALPAEVFVSLGSAYFRQGKMEDAEREWKTAANNNPKLGEAHNNLAALYLMTSRLDDAEKELKLAEGAGYHVHPRLKEDIKKARKEGPTR
jgi:tetratricopeptide (TPR) repeat protein